MQTRLRVRGSENYLHDEEAVFREAIQNKLAILKGAAGLTIRESGASVSATKKINVRGDFGFERESRFLSGGQAKTQASR